MSVLVTRISSWGEAGAVGRTKRARRGEARSGAFVGKGHVLHLTRAVCFADPTFLGRVPGLLSCICEDLFEEKAIRNFQKPGLFVVLSCLTRYTSIPKRGGGD